MTDEAENTLPGETSSTPEIPDFDLIRLIGEGGFGRVWLARNRTIGQLRAVKLIPLQCAGTTDAAGREITSLTRLEEHVDRHHPNLLAIHHVGKTADHLFYVMDPADDVSDGAATDDAAYQPATLHSRLADGPLPPQACLDYAGQLLTGLASLHDWGMVHRDVKPPNCLFVGGHLKLADFGLLTDVGAQVSRVGTQTYMPPDGRMDTRADVYAAGLVIYEMLTGLPAESFPCLGERAADLATDPTLQRLNRLILKACQPDPKQRFADARAMLQELEASESASTAPSTPRRVLAIGLVVAVVGCCLFASIFAAIRFLPSGTEPVPLPPTVSVNFVTDAYEATIYLDGKPLVKPDGTAYTTPCTVENLPPRVHHVVLKHARHGELTVGEVHFGKIREVEARWGQ